MNAKIKNALNGVSGYATPGGVWAIAVVLYLKFDQFAFDVLNRLDQVVRLLEKIAGG